MYVHFQHGFETEFLLEFNGNLEESVYVGQAIGKPHSLDVADCDLVLWDVCKTN
jgi:hypothetical protein